MKKQADVTPVPRDLRCMVAILFDVMTRPGATIEEIADRRQEHEDYMRNQMVRLYDASLIRYAGHAGMFIIDEGVSINKPRTGKINPDRKPPRTLEPHPHLNATIRKLSDKPRFDLVLELEQIVLTTVKD